MDRYEVQSVNLKTEVVEATSQVNALKKFLKEKGIAFKEVIKLTTKVNEELFNQGIDPVTQIDYFVRKEGSYITNNYHVVR